MQIPKVINWSGFLDRIIKPSRSKQESCAWIFADIKTDTWNILEVKNVGLKGRSVRHSFAPDKKEFAKIKRLIRKEKLTKIGCVHTHVVVGEYDEEFLDYQFHPSDPDLSYARRYGDIVRAVIVVYYPSHKNKGQIYGIIWFDQYGTTLERKVFEISC